MMEYFREPITFNLLDFNGSFHVTNHLNYLFRTDKKQKWTNDDTKNNFVIYTFKGRSEVEMFESDISGREKQRDKVKEIIASERIAVSDLYMCRVDCSDSSVYYCNRQITNEILEINDNSRQSASESGFKLIALVCHQDQPETYLHIHLLFGEK